MELMEGGVVMIAKLSSHRQFVVPKEIANQLALKEGDFLKITLVREQGGFLAIPVDVEERYPTDLIKGAAQALEQDLEEGKTFSSLEDMVKDLRQSKDKNPKSKDV
jgi:bifunctional DNA-binding transcriptional regulator/antitoxin component of YhaV-PrlF toxin-antitoxin module